jgi:DNA-binding transcriptional MocR family regulator
MANSAVISAIRNKLETQTARGVANAVSASMRDGELAPGTRLPPIRSLAHELQLSPTTVSAAWALLRRSGTIRTDGRRGSVVGQLPNATALRLRKTVDTEAKFRIDLSGGVPDPALLPDLQPILRRLRVSAAPATYLDEPTLPELRDLVLSTWPYAAPDVMIVDGAMDAIDLVARTVLQFGDRVVVEDPGFPPIQDMLQFLGARIIPVRLDREGLNIEEMAEALKHTVALVFLQPRAQNPTGISMTARRERQLVDLLSGTQTLIIEDDSAGVVASTPARSLGRRLSQQTVHIRSFSKSHGPDLRLAAMSAPEEIFDAMSARRQLGQGWTSRVLQRVMVSLLSNDESIARVARARTIYRERRREFVRALRAAGVDVGGDDGINVWVPVVEETTAVVRLASRGIGVAPGSPFMSRQDAGAHIRVSISMATADVAAIAREVAAAARLDPWAPRR